MISRIQKWGNSQGLRLSKTLLSDVDTDVDDAVDVAVHKGALIVTPVRRVWGGHDLRDLVRRVPKGYKPGELDWGSPVGSEVGRWRTMCHATHASTER
jgi:antitoxin MazE